MSEHNGTDSLVDEWRFVKFAEALPLGIFLLDGNGKPYFANRAATELLGKGLVPSAKLDELAEIYRAYRADTMTEYPTDELPIVRALGGESVIIDDMVIFRPDGVIPLRVWAAPIYDEQGELLFAMAAFADISSQKAAEEKLARQAKSLADFSHRLKQLHRLNTRSFSDHDTLVREYLKAGVKVFSMSTGILSHIVGKEYTVVDVLTDLEGIVPGMVFDLQNTYCNAVIKTQKTVAYSHVGRIRSMLGHPVYQNLKLEAYISAPITVHGEIFGTLNFSATTPREDNFERHDFELIELMADNIGRFIEIEALRKDHARVVAELEALRAKSEK